ncbi:unnamed protein product [Chrysodeixis includens]|uniref:Uncharacterized protein n=1 Tax=Chrysodeixis includens TaxID=689277 RepID=A0A9P0BML7_CHRIL|nr:unnamed protein product [Chrysodeixis includens]
MEEPTSSDDKKLDKTVEEASDVEKDGTVPEEDSDSSSSSGSVCQCDLDDDDVDKTKAETSDVEENDTKPAEPASSAEPQHSKDNQDDVPKVAPKAKRGKGPRASTNFKRCAVPPKLGALKLKRKKRYTAAGYERRLRDLYILIRSTVKYHKSAFLSMAKLMKEVKYDIVFHHFNFRPTPKPQPPGSEASGSQASGSQASESQASGSQASGSQASGSQASGSRPSGSNPNRIRRSFYIIL